MRIKSTVTMADDPGRPVSAMHRFDERHPGGCSLADLVATNTKVTVEKPDGSLVVYELANDDGTLHWPTALGRRVAE